MNKIVVVNEKVENTIINNNIDISFKEKESLFDISVLTININKSDELFLTIDTNMTKLKVDFNIQKDVDTNIYIIVSGKDGKIRYSYNVLENSNVNVLKYNKAKNIKEMVEVSLNGTSAKLDYLFKSISMTKENYDYQIIHNCKNTISNIKNHGVNISGEMNIQIATTVPKDITDCTCNQFNRIINLTNNKCEIRPILYIDNNLVDANHAALIGDFDENELFYLESRGIEKKDAYSLLIKGFINSGVNFEIIKSDIDDYLNKHWR